MTELEHAIGDLEMLVEILRLESGGSLTLIGRLQSEEAVARRIKENAIQEQDFETASRWRDRERELHHRIDELFEHIAGSDVMWRLRQRGLVEFEDGSPVARLTAAGRRLAIRELG